MSSAATPDKIGRYQILERVGRGGMGVLYRGFDPILDREVAVKVMLADFSEDTEQMRPRFYREAKAVAKLQHRNIVTIFEFAEENNQPHIVMEFLRGLPLNARMEQNPPLTLDDKLDIVAQLCSGLGYAHTQGVVHRDVKPANVFILEDGTVKLLDFGIAKLATSTLTRQGDVVGSAPYMSPEQIAGTQDLDGRSDVWSTGVLLFELLAGRKPFDGDAPDDGDRRDPEGASRRRSTTRAGPAEAAGRRGRPRADKDRDRRVPDRRGARPRAAVDSQDASSCRPAADGRDALCQHERAEGAARRSPEAGTRRGCATRRCNRRPRVRRRRTGAARRSKMWMIGAAAARA